MAKTNTEISQDRAHDAIDHFNKWGFIIFPQNLKVYDNIARELSARPTHSGSVLDVGCGNGVGTAFLDNYLGEFWRVSGADKLDKNVNFAKCLYPWMRFHEWDVQKMWDKGTEYGCVTCVEAIEHLANPKLAVENMLGIARNEVWISTPNGVGKHKPPTNPYHVYEYSPEEMLDVIYTVQPSVKVEILHWETLESLGTDTLIDPLIYRIRK
jgi:2-polyprenyl-3-methyl-5-hydroxy-6-metoxy-1,4-benzoquinol methylase